MWGNASIVNDKYLVLLFAIQNPFDHVYHVSPSPFTAAALLLVSTQNKLRNDYDFFFRIFLFTANTIYVYLGHGRDTVNRVIHHRKSYLHDCESVELNRIAESMEFERNGFIVLNTQRWKCDPNGWYARIQHTTE